MDSIETVKKVEGDYPQEQCLDGSSQQPCEDSDFEKECIDNICDTLCTDEELKIYKVGE